MAISKEKTRAKGLRKVREAQIHPVVKGGGKAKASLLERRGRGDVRART